MTIFYLSRGDHPIDLAAASVSQNQTFSTEGLGDEELLFGEFLNEPEPKLVAVLVDSTGITGGELLLIVDNEVYADITGIKDFFLIVAANISILLQSISTWNISTLTHIQDFTISSFSPRDIFFSPDGVNMYLGSSIIRQYTLSIPWDITTATLVRTKDVSDDLDETSAGAHGLGFKYDGRKMYVAGHSNGEILEYNLSTPWNIATASFVHKIGSSDSSPHTVVFKPDGTKMYTCGQSPSRIFEWDLTTPWDISTALIVNTETLGLFVPQGIAWKPDGTKMYVAALNASPAGTRIREFNLTTPWDISTATLNQSFTLSTSVSGATGIYIRVDGVKVYVTLPNGSTDVSEYEINISEPHAGDALVMVIQGEQLV